MRRAALALLLAGCGSPPASLKGPLAFEVASAVEIYEHVDGGPDHALVWLLSAERAAACASLTTDKPLPEGKALSLYFQRRDGPLVTGDYTLFQGGEVLNDVTASGRTVVFGTGGSGTLDQAGPSLIKGSFSTTLALPDGGASPLSGTFEASACP